MTPGTELLRILDLARWAPSGDNTQPWRFEVIGSRQVLVHGFDTREHCVYDIDGRPSQMSIGALIETMSVAASGVGWEMRVSRLPSPESRPVFDVRFRPDAGLPPSPLLPCIECRSVQRRPLRMSPISALEKSEIEAAVGPNYRIVWYEGMGARWRCARLMFENAKLRLTMPEAYEVHRSIIDWGRRFSEDKVPDQALGADRLTLQLMRFAMKRWERIEVMNRWLAGTLAPRIQMDLLPGVACGAHLVIVAATAPRSIDDWVDAGRAMQRLWLTATRLGLQKQPELTPLVFAGYVDAGRPFTRVQALHRQAQHLRDRLAGLLGDDLPHAVWMARIGHGEPARARSLRLPLSRLLVAASVAASRPTTVGEPSDGGGRVAAGAR